APARNRGPSPPLQRALRGHRALGRALVSFAPRAQLGRSLGTRGGPRRAPDRLPADGPGAIGPVQSNVESALARHRWCAPRAPRPWHALPPPLRQRANAAQRADRVPTTAGRGLSAL